MVLSVKNEIEREVERKVEEGKNKVGHTLDHEANRNEMAFENLEADKEDEKAGKKKDEKGKIWVMREAIIALLCSCPPEHGDW